MVTLAFPFIFDILQSLNKVVFVALITISKTRKGRLSNKNRDLVIDRYGGGGFKSILIPSNNAKKLSNSVSPFLHYSGGF